MTTQPNCGWVKLWHRRGVHVTIPLSGDINTFSDQIDTLFENGWLATEPGLETGEERGECGWVVHSRKDGRNGEVDVLDLYLVEDKFPKVRIYLNTQEDTQAFETVSGLRVSKMPIYVGTNKIERGASRQADQFVVKAPRPFGFVWKANPKYNPDEKDAKLKKPARIFVRWADQKLKQDHHADTRAEEQPDEVQAWREWLSSTATDPETLTSVLPDLAKMDRQLKEQVWHIFKIHADTKGWEFDREAKRFVRAK